MLNLFDKETLVSADKALVGRDEAMQIAEPHVILKNPLTLSADELVEQGLSQALFGLGCFWGAEKHFWSLPGVHTTAAGYAGGFTTNPTYQEVCSGQTGHTEVVWLAFDPIQLSYERLLKEFWQAHNPTQGMRQGNDKGTQYRSAIYAYSDAQIQAAEQSKTHYQTMLKEQEHPVITTEIKTAPQFYYAEDYHQQYLAKNPDGYCGLGGTGVCY
ncbi:MAG: peptide-methionine (S)-S-oxide reductase MsrA [Flavobacteriaceae bacterium]|uniref:Peptide methionine sulfoxide reductase MsrA n=1 Tax=SAR86 cluster bacterium TaxID=2030880 RepID=A0A2A5CEY8_9GAMM|nr:peptide-methionine (S)-S-oxide reductase MsrA [Flavobacteriaceae bacterium]MBN4053677.1 peptide-methionine (S)-S-oxide reductase MsrA [Haliea sp. AH-315-K21]PCJ42065.1 MAG: peptide-methionine (S)-S-oxide reductase [SAR86 cluster bacterium]